MTAMLMRPTDMPPRQRVAGEPNPTTRAQLTIRDLEVSQSSPSRKQVDVWTLRDGDVLGWLTLLETPAGSGSPLLVRCICGAVTAPPAWAVAKGAFRSCENHSLHGLHL